MKEINYNVFIELSKKFNDKPFDVTPAFADFQISKGIELKFYVDSLQQPMILCWAEVKKIKIIGLVLNIHGPTYSDDVSIKQLQKFYKNITCLEYNGFFINSTLEYSVLFEEAIRKAGFKRPIGQSSTNLTIVVDTFNFNPDTNWRRNLKKASKAIYTVESKKELSLDECLIIENLHKENAESKKLSYTLKANQIYKLCKASNIEVFFLKLENEFIAARIISVEENISYDIFACNSFKSRLDGATQFLMQYIFDYLKNQNIQYFDFSRIPLGRKGAYGVYEFKKSTRGKLLQYNSEWVFFKNKKLRHLYYLYNLIINKKDFY